MITERATTYFNISSVCELNFALQTFKRIGRLAAADPVFLQRLDAVACHLAGNFIDSSASVEMTVIECDILVQLLVTHQGVMAFDTLDNLRAQVDQFDYYPHPKTRAIPMENLYIRMYEYTYLLGLLNGPFTGNRLQVPGG